MFNVKCNSCSLVAINGIPCHEHGCPTYMTVYIDNKKRVFYKYRVFSLDVLGNSKDGFEVNDRSECGTIMVPADSPDPSIAVLKALKNEMLLNKKRQFKSFRVDGDDMFISIEVSKSSEPIYQLEVV